MVGSETLSTICVHAVYYRFVGLNLRRYSLSILIKVRLYIAFLSLIVLFGTYAGCDSDISGTAFENRPPNTSLSVRDSSLVDNLSSAERLESTLFVSWSGDDPDGFVASFELRFFPTSQPVASPEEGWTRTTSNDSLVLLPIPPGQKDANVIFEVRAIDNEGLTDPSPARTVFPIENAPPSVRLNSFDLPPDTTFQIVSLGWEAQDPEGEESIARIDISLNDSVNFSALPPEFDFATLVGDVDPGDPGQNETTARVFLGRGFQGTDIHIPNLLLDSDNTVYVRAVDLTDTTSTIERYTWYVKKQRSDVLYVNDWRKSKFPVLQGFHVALLQRYLPPDVSVDTWDITLPFATGAAGNVPRSELLPANADPTLRQTLALYKHIYWVATNTTRSVQRNNFPFAAGVLDLFFENGGTMIVHSAITLPPNPEDNLGNPAILLLPLTSLITFPDTLRQQLRLRPGATVTPVGQPPGVGTMLPQLSISSFNINTLPYVVGGTNTIPLYEASYTFVSSSNNQGPWTGPSTVASISADQRIALFAVPLINEQSGEPILIGDADPSAGQAAIHLILESRGFPKR